MKWARDECLVVMVVELPWCWKFEGGYGEDGGSCWRERERDGI